MPKEPYWTNEEEKILVSLLDKWLSWQEISEHMGRSVFSLKNKRARISYQPKCKDCKYRIETRKGARQRCVECSRIHTDLLKSEYIKTPEQRKKQKEKRDKVRFGGKREKVLVRDGHRCVKCGLSNEEHIKKYNCEITVDHINGKGRDNKEQDNRLVNLQTLCLKCHGTKDWKRRRKDWSMCADALNKTRERIKPYCVSCKKPQKKHIARFFDIGNYCYKCVGIAEDRLRAMPTPML